MKPLVIADGDGRRAVTLQALPRGGGTWEGRALGAEPFAPEATCDPGVVPTELLARVTAPSRDAALAAVEAELRRRFRVV